MFFPIQAMYQLKIANQINKTAFIDFFVKALLIQVEIEDPLVKLNETIKREFKEHLKNIPIYVGLADELMTTEFLNKLYANLKLTGKEGLYKMNQETKKYNLIKEGSKLLQTLTEDVKLIFKSALILDWYSTDNILGSLLILNFFEIILILIFLGIRIYKIVYPKFHPDRPYFVNLAYMMKKNYHFFLDKRREYLKSIGIELSEKAIKLNDDFMVMNMHLNYLIYLEKFGPEQNLPGFLMTNQQLLEVIHYQTWSRKYQNGNSQGPSSLSNYVFSCNLNNTNSKCMNKMDMSHNCLLEHLKKGKEIESKIKTIN